jgi:hypothetical protein
MIHLLTEAHVRITTIARHTTQIFQLLDVIFFGILKRRSRYELPFDDEKATMKCTMKVYHDFKQTMAEPHIWRALPAIGFEFDTEGEPCRLVFNEEKPKRSADLRELSSIDFEAD